MSKEKEKTVEIKEEEAVKKTSTKKTPAKTTTKKTETKKTVETEDPIEEVEVAEEATETPIRKKSIKIDLNELIPVRSVVKGRLTYVSPKTGQTTIWRKFGDVEFLEFGEIMTIKASKERFITEPFFVIDDEEVVEKLGLQSLYERIFYVDKLDEFYDLPLEKMKLELEKVPKGVKKLIGDRASELIKEGKLYDIRKIKVLEEKLKLDFSLLEALGR